MAAVLSSLGSVSASQNTPSQQILIIYNLQVNVLGPEMNQEDKVPGTSF